MNEVKYNIAIFICTLCVYVAALSHERESVPNWIGWVVVVIFLITHYACKPKG